MHSKLDNSKELIREFLLNFQNDLTSNLENLDGKAKFIEDKWTNPELGGGKTRVLSNGDLFEQGGVNFSEISKDKVPESLLGHKPELKDQKFWGAGVSMVLHPKSPLCPTVHLNYRYFEAGSVFWFGGGADLTPYYPFEEDCILWHQAHKDAMDKHDPNFYPAFKYWCDEYFYNHHRGETRGIGGVFYDYQDGKEGLLVKADYARKSEDNNNPALNLKIKPKTWDELFSFHKDTSAAFLKAYRPIINKRKDIGWGDYQRDFQLYRRGRYVEFNLLYDRGTLFGLQSKGRVESILMSLPPLVRWQYNYHPEPGTKEFELTDKFLTRGVDWVV